MFYPDNVRYSEYLLQYFLIYNIFCPLSLLLLSKQQRYTIVFQNLVLFHATRVSNEDINFFVLISFLSAGELFLLSESEKVGTHITWPCNSRGLSGSLAPKAVLLLLSANGPPHITSTDPADQLAAVSAILKMIRSQS